MTTFFTSDQHFGHARINDLAGRPFGSVEEMNETIIERHNAVVKPDDTVFHLGDVALGTLAESLPLVGRLNGRKILIPGNHDRIFSQNKPAYIERFLPQYLAVFDEVYPEIVEHGDGFMMCHFPYAGDSHEVDRHADRRPIDLGAPLVHGHVHEAWKVNGRQFNVGVDANDFTPVSLDEVLEFCQTC